MKTLTIPLLFVAIATASSFRAYVHVTPSATEEEAIKQVIIKETEAFWNKDFNGLAEQWAHKDYIRVLGWWERGGITVLKGWSVIGGRMKTLITENPEKNHQQVTREDMNVHISGDMAWVTFEQYGTDTGEAAMDMPGLSYETRILEKHKGQWKIVYASWLLDGRKKQ